MIPALLEQIIGPPVVTPLAPDWEAVAAQYGLVFPADYRALTERYSALDICQYFSVYHPTSRSGNLFSVLEAQIQAVKVYLQRTQTFAGGWDPKNATVIPSGEEVEVDYDFFPEPGGLLPWGVGENGAKCLWLTHEHPEKWTVVIGDDYFGWWHYKGSMTSFLVDVISQRIVCPVIDDTFPEDWLDEVTYQNP
ncbi:hypothetical protein [Actinomadura sp. 9N407]|uniref:hypothetical protein n=1 Tax=Actinomadura sp. 9N407 TaxID=3375154 RepID=UPI0037916483